jgi:hypothetical protein
MLTKDDMNERSGKLSPEGARGLPLISEPDLLRLFEYWCSKRSGSLMPCKGDIDPIEISWALSRIFLLDYSPEDGFRYRLAGAEVAEIFGRTNLKGFQLTDILSPERAKMVAERWDPLVRDRCVICMKGMVYLPAERIPIGERLLLPLADTPDGPVTGLLGSTVFKWVAGDLPQEIELSRIEYVPVDRIP